MKKINIYNGNQIVSKGLVSFIEAIGGYQITEFTDGLNKETFQNNTPDITIIDYASDNFDFKDLMFLLENKQSKVVAITPMRDKNTFVNAINLGVHAHILNCCDFGEVKMSLQEVVEGKRFFCGKILDVVNEDETSRGCEPVSLSERELEIIKYIAEGHTNKEIADQLHLSTHTVNTHRKNITSKLGVKNTAGIVIYAVRSNLISPNKYLFSQ